MNPWTDLSDLQDIHKGEKCFICGAGPSIAFLDLKEIHNFLVISVNSSAILMPWEAGEKNKRFWVSNDTLVTRWSYFEKVKHYNCHKVIRTSWKGRYDELKDHNFRYFAPRPSDCHPLSDSCDYLCSVSSVPTAIDLAILMGCNRIYLLGVDQTMVHGNSHFWQFWNRDKWPRRSDKGRYYRPEQKHQIKIFKQNQEVFESLKEYAVRRNVKIYNCSSRSLLKTFECKSLENALK